MPVQARFPIPLSIRMHTCRPPYPREDPAGHNPNQACATPQAWTSLQDTTCQILGRAPVKRGSRFALAGLRSVAETATLRVVAWGWAPQAGPLRASLDPLI